MQVHKSHTHPHIEWIEIHNDGILHEVAVLKVDNNKNKLFFPINNLDNIDKQRLSMILRDRQAGNLELWDLMLQKTLNNGINALQYFHQYVKVLTQNGKIVDPKSGQIGIHTTGTINTNSNA